MKALKYVRPRSVELVEEPEPQPGPDEELVQVSFAGICGSDLHGVLPGGYRTPPLIMGHEFSGVTPEGRRVAVNATVSCGRCDMCRRGREQLCRDRQILGIHRPGGFAQRVAVPAGALVDLPDGTSLEAGALVEPLAVTLRGWHRSGATADSRVAILGAGNIGLLLLAVGSRMGCDITIVDTDPRRRNTAERQGPVRVAAELEGEYDVVFDAVGSREAHRASLEHLTPGGTALWIGSRDTDPAYDALDVVRSEKSVIASFAYSPTDFQEAARLVAELSLDWVEVVDMEEGPRVFDDLLEQRIPTVKALIRP